ncbi:hypothetical protein GJ496_005948, partial [Pomphorhynchus laevis]
ISVKHFEEILQMYRSDDLTPVKQSPACLDFSADIDGDDVKDCLDYIIDDIISDFGNMSDSSEDSFETGSSLPIPQLPPLHSFLRSPVLNFDDTSNRFSGTGRSFLQMQSLIDLTMSHLPRFTVTIPGTSDQFYLYDIRAVNEFVDDTYEERSISQHHFLLQREFQRRRMQAAAMHADQTSNTEGDTDPTSTAANPSSNNASNG